MLINLDVNDNKASQFIEFLKNLDFVKINQTELSEEHHINLLNERMEEYKSGKDSSVELKEVLQSLRLKYGF